MFLRNSTLLPVQWRLNGLENLGEDFSVVTDHGVIEPRSEYGLQVHFRAARPITLKKIIRLEVWNTSGKLYCYSNFLHAESVF